VKRAAEGHVGPAHHAEIERPYLLAREGSVHHNGALVFRTPLLIPSFSSKGFSEMKEIMRLMREFITDAVLVSAYDIHYKHLAPERLTFPSVIFLDSGGYEARVEHDLSEAYGQDYKPKKWTDENHRRVIHKWQSTIPTVIVSYDSPHRHSRIAQQVKRAIRLKTEFPNFAHEILVKPELAGHLVEPSTLGPVLEDLKAFPIIGFTEYELDNSIFGRMVKIANIRRMLDDAGIMSPIHVFGSLDSLSTALYFAAGAEIFDGLTWLRFGFYEGQTVYRQNFGAICGVNGILKNAEELSHAMWKDNYYYLQSLANQMCNFARKKDAMCFDHIGTRVKAAVDQLESRLTA
jgi:hypothetical protein